MQKKISFSQEDYIFYKVIEDKTDLTKCEAYITDHTLVKSLDISPLDKGTGWYPINTPKIQEYYEPLDFYKLKSNWCSGHIINPTLVV